MNSESLDRQRWRALSLATASEASLPVDERTSEASDDIPHRTAEHSEGVRLSIAEAPLVRTEAVRLSVKMTPLARAECVRSYSSADQLEPATNLNRERGPAPPWSP